MWSGLEKILEHVSSYSTNAGKLWYLLVFVFRLIVVATVGQSVYSDEQSAFRCSTKVIGCDNVCYDRFSKISHIRYWAFQLLAVTAPAVVFHFYSLNVQGRIAKIEKAENDVQDDDSRLEDSIFGSGHWDTEDEIRRKNEQRKKRKLLRRRKSVGIFKQKPVYAHNNIVNLTLTRDIRIAYVSNVALRIILEAISLYLAYILFHFADYTIETSYNPLNYILIKVPQVYRCDGENVEWACGQHLNLGDQTGYVPCWVSRPYEKTIFMCYMNILSAICCILSIIEFFQLCYKYSTNYRKKRMTHRGAKRTVSMRENQAPLFQSVDETDGIGRRKSQDQAAIVPFRQFSEKPSVTIAPNSYSDMPPPPQKKSPAVVHMRQPYPEKTSQKVNPSIQPWPKSVKTKSPDWVTMSKVRNEMKCAKKKSPRNMNTKKKRPVGIKLQDTDEQESLGSLYHSSEYEETGSSDTDGSLPSVSVASNDI